MPLIPSEKSDRLKRLWAKVDRANRAAHRALDAYEQARLAEVAALGGVRSGESGGTEAMTITVGKHYRGLFAGEPHWFYVTGIEARADNTMTIIYRISRRKLPWVLSWCAMPQADYVEVFVRKLDAAREYELETHRLAESRRIVKTPREVEVRYK